MEDELIKMKYDILNNPQLKEKFAEKIKLLIFRSNILCNDIEDLKISILKNNQSILLPEEKKELKEYEEMQQAINNAKPLVLLQLVNNLE